MRPSSCQKKIEEVCGDTGEGLLAYLGPGKTWKYDVLLLITS